MLSLMAGLYHYSQTLFEILKSNNLATEHDLPAFSAIASLPPDAPSDIRLFVESYRKQAESLGLPLPI